MCQDDAYMMMHHHDVYLITFHGDVHVIILRCLSDFTSWWRSSDNMSLWRFIYHCTTLYGVNAIHLTEDHLSAWDFFLQHPACGHLAGHNPQYLTPRSLHHLYDRPPCSYTVFRASIPPPLLCFRMLVFCYLKQTIRLWSRWKVEGGGWFLEKEPLRVG